MIFLLSKAIWLSFLERLVSRVKNSRARKTAKNPKSFRLLIIYEEFSYSKKKQKKYKSNIKLQVSGVCGELLPTYSATSGVACSAKCGSSYFTGK